MKDESRKELDEIRELLRMAAVQTAATAKGLDRHAEQFAHDLKASRDEHDREMKELIAARKQRIIAVAEELRVEAEDEVIRLRSLGWKQADFAHALKDLLQRREGN